MEPDGRNRDGREFLARLVLGDLIAVGAGFALASFFCRLAGRFDVPSLPTAAVVTGGFGLLTVLLGFWCGAYAHTTSVLQYSRTRVALRAMAMAAAVAFGLLFLTRAGNEIPRVWLLGAMVLSVVLMVMGRQLLAAAARRIGIRRRALRTVIAGGGSTSRRLLEKLVRTSATEFDVLGFVADDVTVDAVVSCDEAAAAGEPLEAPVLGRTGQISEIVHRHAVSVILVSTAELSGSVVRDILEAVDRATVEVRLVLDPAQAAGDATRIEDIMAIPILRRDRRTDRPMYEAVKRTMDLMLSIPLLVVLSPLMAIAAAWIRLDSPGRVLNRELRAGHDGSTFTLLEFRAPAGLGALFHRTSMKKIPWLINVIRGDMSLVGPRPELPRTAESYSATERVRLAVKPGLTGLWQVSPDRGPAIRESLEYDFFYVAHRSMLLDAMILFETVLLGFGTICRFSFRREASRERDASAEKGVVGS